MQRAILVVALVLAACSTASSGPEREAPEYCSELSSSARSEVVTLDELPRPVNLDRMFIPDRLRESPVEGTASVEITLAEEGQVLSASVVESDLPDDFGPFLEREVRSWQFTEPTVNGGCPIKAKARIDIPVTIR